MLLLGSNRQSQRIEEHNSESRKNASFPLMPEIARHIKATHNPMLLADVYGELELGESYRRATNKGEDHAESRCDNSKLTLLYMQMHALAQEYPNENIVFDFYDDVADILTFLQDFFAEKSAWIPQNITLRLHRYNGFALQNMGEPIQGQGEIDENFRETIQDIADLCAIPGKTSIDVKKKVADLTTTSEEQPQRVQEVRSGGAGPSSIFLRPPTPPPPHITDEALTSSSGLKNT